MKTTKIKPWMPLRVKYITKDSGKDGLVTAWKTKPVFDETVWVAGGFICALHSSGGIKPGEIIKVIK